MLAHELVQLAVEGKLPVRHGHDVTIVETPIVASFDESRADGDVVLAREPEELARRRPVRNRLGERLDFIARELANVPVTR